MPTVKIASVFDGLGGSHMVRGQCAAPVPICARGQLSFDPVEPAQFTDRLTEGEYQDRHAGVWYGSACSSLNGIT